MSQNNITIPPNNISTDSAATWGVLKTHIGANSDQLWANDQTIWQTAQYVCLMALGPSILPGSPAALVTGVGTATFGVANGVIACVPQGSIGAYTGAVIVVTSAVGSQAAVLSATNYVWLQSDPTLAAPALIINTTSVPPANSVLLATALVGASTITSITQQPINYVNVAGQESTGPFIVGVSAVGSSAYIGAA